MLTAALLLALQLRWPLAATPPRPLFAPGERLHYKGYALGYFPVGDAWFEVHRAKYGGREAYRFDARALGRYVIYTLDIRLSSIVDAASLKSLLFQRREVGSEKREYQIIFDRNALRAVYRRKPGRFTSVEAMDKTPWENRSTFPIRPEVNDILYTLYLARDIGDAVGAKKNYWLVEKTHIWKTTVTATGEKRLDLGRAGTFDALKIAIEPDYTGERELKEKFSGLFGVEGSLEVWVDKKTRIPLIVRGQVPFAYILRPTISVILQDYRIRAKNDPAP
jgi:hypothetical protein